MALPLGTLVGDPLVTLVKKLAAPILDILGLVRKISVPRRASKLSLRVERGDSNSLVVDIPGLPPRATKKGRGIIYTSCLPSLTLARVEAA